MLALVGLPRAGERFAKYDLVRVVGRGGMGVVYEAHDRDLDRRVALKLLLPELGDLDHFRGRFRREAGVLARLRSRHIVHILEYGEHDGAVYFVTDFMSDGDLREHLERSGPLHPKAALRLLAQICEGLQDAHDAGVIHRDIKPNNVLLWRRGGRTLIPYLCDFGIATDGGGNNTRTGTIIGSVGFMAPERHRGVPATAQGDIYGMGCLLHSVLTGHPPYEGTEYEVMTAHLQAPVPGIHTGAASDWLLNALLAQMMAKDPDGRFQSAAALGNACDQILIRLD